MDHIDGNPRNNKRDNLRIVTAKENIRNKKDHPTKGVHYRKDRNKFAAAIKVNGIKQHLGYFDTAEDAHTAYLSAINLADRLLGNIK